MWFLYTAGIPTSARLFFLFCFCTVTVCGDIRPLWPSRVDLRSPTTSQAPAEAGLRDKDRAIWADSNATVEINMLWSIDLSVRGIFRGGFAGRGYAREWRSFPSYRHSPAGEKDTFHVA